MKAVAFGVLLLICAAVYAVAQSPQFFIPGTPAGANDINHAFGLTLWRSNNLSDVISTSNARANLGVPTGTTGHVLPYLDQSNAWAGPQTFANMIGQGGTIDGIPVGDTTRSTGKFTVADVRTCVTGGLAAPVGNAFSICAGLPFTQPIQLTSFSNAGAGWSFDGPVLIGSTPLPAASREHISYQPGLLTSVVGTKSAFHKFSYAGTVDNIEGSANTKTCSVDPVVTLYECGTDASCASPTTIGSATVTTAGQAFDGTVSTPAIGATHYLAWGISAGTCTALDIVATAQIHSN